jgi:hypothetical protein
MSKQAMVGLYPFLGGNRGAQVTSSASGRPVRAIATEFGDSQVSRVELGNLRKTLPIK